MQKAHQNINWENLPSTNTPLNQTNLNSMDQAIDTIDDRVVAFDTSKANQTDMLVAVKDVRLNTSTGVITIEFFNGTTRTIDTAMEKIAVNFRYESNPQSPNYQKLIITHEDGTVEYVDLRTLISDYDFADTSTIHPSVTNGTAKFDVIDGSITESKLQPNFLADVRVEAARAQAASSASSDSALLSQSWAEGGTDIRPGEDSQNSKYYAEQAQNTVAQLLAAFGLSVVGARLIFGAVFEESYGIAVSNTTLVFSEITP